MLKINLKINKGNRADGSATLAASGSLTVEETSEMKSALNSALAGAGEVRVDFSGLTGIDVSGIQLLCAAHKSAYGAGKRLVLEGLSEKVACHISDSGFRHLSGCMGGSESQCLWGSCREREDR